MNTQLFLQHILDNITGTILGLVLIGGAWFYKIVFYPDYGDWLVAIVSVILFLGAMTLTDYLMFKNKEKTE